jgi:hypothetical protein
LHGGDDGLLEGRIGEVSTRQPLLRNHRRDCVADYRSIVVIDALARQPAMQSGSHLACQDRAGRVDSGRQRGGRQWTEQRFLRSMVV